jgi:uncharacterized membrane protein YhaH (DUF805 family)
MLQELFSGWCSGRLSPRRFAVLWSTVVIILVGTIFLAFASAITWVALFNPDGSLRAAMGFFIAEVVTILLMTAALFNIVIKRGRDIGMPGFVTAIGFIILCCMGGLTVFLSMLLALVPSGTFSSARV